MRLLRAPMAGRGVETALRGSRFAQAASAAQVDAVETHGPAGQVLLLAQPGDGPG